MVNRERLLKLFIDLVEIDSPSGHEGAIRDFLNKLWRERGLNVYEDQAGQKLGGDSGNLWLAVPGQLAGPTLLFCAHMDTVEPGRQIKAVLQEDGYVRSTSDTILGSDDKAAIACMIEAYDCLRENNIQHPPLEFLFTVSEEQGLLGVKEFDFSQLKADLAFVLDDGHKPGAIVVRSPCQNEIEYIARGQAAHAGMCPENGVNAIFAAASALSKMPCGRLDEETTCNFGIIEGGLARNIVPDLCRIKGEARSLNSDKLESLTRQLEQSFTEEVESYGAKAEVNIKFLYPAVSLTADQEVVALPMRAANKIGLNTQMVSTGGGSDTSIINGSGIPCVNLGLGMEEVHTCHEQILLDDLVSVVNWLLAIIDNACQTK